MSLAMAHEWKLRPLVGICTAPLLAVGGSIRTAEGYDRGTRLWCANVPTLQVPESPRRADAEAALRRLRKAFRTFPFADAVRNMDFELGAEVVDLDRAPGRDESAFLVGLLTAVCRPHLPLAPGLLIRAPEIADTGLRNLPCVRPPGREASPVPRVAEQRGMGMRFRAACMPAA
jgi:hypothetical protein